jgi:hypothetical protein
MQIMRNNNKFQIPLRKLINNIATDELSIIGTLKGYIINGTNCMQEEEYLIVLENLDDLINQFSGVVTKFELLKPIQLENKRAIGL